MTRAPLRRILVVEDDPDILLVAKTALETVGGFKVEGCDSGKKAMSKVGAFKPDLIVLDLMMPEMDGTATLAALRASPQSASIPVIFMTAKVQRHEMEHHRLVGALGVISKPFDPMTLSETVRKIWEGTHG